MDARLTDLIRRIHDAPHRAVVAVTGGGSRAISDLLCVPGASRTVLEALVPYAATALVEFLRGKPEQFCSSATARAMAMAAYRRAEQLRDNEEHTDTAEQAGSGTRTDESEQDARPVVGLGLTASLASDRPKRGPHRIHVAAQTENCTWSQTLDLAKGARSRDEEESLAAASAINLLAEACDLTERLPLALRAEERVERRRTDAPQSWADLLAGKTQCVRESRDGDSRPAAKGVFPGAFHPLHDGHRRMAALAAKKLGGQIDFEISIENVDKLPLDFEEMQTRRDQFAATGETLWFTRAPLFVDKATLFRGKTFVVGADTLVRLADPKYAGDSIPERDRILAAIAGCGCRFLVFGRQTAHGFETLDDLILPDVLRHVCEGVSEAEFRADVSSTELRRRAAES